ncbi:hypothetical protein O181_111015, partial [Austropuccinia psidii MF-1]|nr:hypothetical protein [Austropuccinia psidii MF-1]
MASLHALTTSSHHLKDTSFLTLHVFRSYIISTWWLVPQEMDLCTCLHCITYTTNQPNRPVAGQLISLCNKRKHKENDYVNPPLKESGSEDSESLPSESESEDVNYPADSDESLSGEPFMRSRPSQWIHVDPLVDELLVLKDGVTIKTYRNPEGGQRYVHLLPLIGDLVAIHKVVGFCSHSANQFCSWCKCEANNLPLLKTGTHRIGMEVIEAAQAWKGEKSVSSQEQIHKKTGVRWSELNRIPYRIPNMHIALGVMHNWLEGVLCEHFCHQWGFQEDAQEKKKRRLESRTHKGKRVRLENNMASDDGDSTAKIEGFSEMSSDDVQL